MTIRRAPTTERAGRLSRSDRFGRWALRVPQRPFTMGASQGDGRCLEGARRVGKGTRTAAAVGRRAPLPCRRRGGCRRLAFVAARRGRLPRVAAGRAGGRERRLEHRRHGLPVVGSGRRADRRRRPSRARAVARRSRPAGRRRPVPRLPRPGRRRSPGPDDQRPHRRPRLLRDQRRERRRPHQRRPVRLRRRRRPAQHVARRHRGAPQLDPVRGREAVGGHDRRQGRRSRRVGGRGAVAEGRRNPAALDVGLPGLRRPRRGGAQPPGAASWPPPLGSSPPPSRAATSRSSWSDRTAPTWSRVRTCSSRSACATPPRTPSAATSSPTSRPTRPW